MYYNKSKLQKVIKNNETLTKSSEIEIFYYQKIDVSLCERGKRERWQTKQKYLQHYL